MPRKIEVGKVFRSALDSDLSGLRYKSLGDAICQRLDAYADQVIFIDHETSTSWTGEQVKQIILSIAAYLVEQFDLVHGETVCIHYDHSIKAIFLALGILCAGGCVVQTDNLLPYEEVMNVVVRTQTKLWFTYADCVDYSQKFSSTSQYNIDIRASMSLDDDLTELFEYSKQQELLQLPVSCKDSVDKSDIAFVLFSSGTSGLPKAVPRTHANELILFSDRTLKLRKKNQVAICDTPLSYLTGVIKLLTGVHLGTKSVFASFKNLTELLEVIEKYRVTRLLVGMATLYEFMAFPNLKQYDISSIQALTFGGARLSFLQVAKKFFLEHPNVVELRDAYGSTECGALTLRVAKPEIYLQSPGNNGFVLPDVEIKIVDAEDHSQLLSTNQVGMICAKGPQNFPGYLNQDGDKTVIKRDESVFDADGFYITGDIGYFDEHENLHVEGRYKETMTCRGLLKVLPFELEATLAEHPSVSSACVLGIPSEDNPACVLPRAFITLNSTLYSLKDVSEYKGYSDDKPVDEELRELKWCGKHELCSLDDELRHAVELDIAKFMKLKLSFEKQLIGGIIILDKFPKLKPSEKIDKCKLRALNEDTVQIYGFLDDTRIFNK